MKCILLFNLGGPDSLDAVEPFLTNLFSDPDILSYPLGPLRPPLARWIAHRRVAKVRALYEKIGGKSPLLGLTNRQAAALEKALNPPHPVPPPPGGRVGREAGEYRVFTAMRYWRPFIEEAAETAWRLRPDTLVLLPLYPQYSDTTTGSGFREFDRVLRRLAPANPVQVVPIPHFFDQPGYIEAMAETVREGIAGTPGDPADPVHLLFSAHGLPQRCVRRGDPYVGQVEKTVSWILDRIGRRENARLGYQSRVGPVKWIGPSTEEVLEEMARQGARRVLLIPVSFVSDHLETLYEMDLLFRQRGEALGIPHVHRAPALNDAPPFIAALKELVLSAVGSTAG
ncbi:MAG: ferrochelatase [Nitrospirae bacterium]|nr:ferrochelatase [Nitrospirota bacterium]